MIQTHGIVPRAPAISVVLPVFNAEIYIAEAVRSILNQTFRDFEFIIINDGSTDNTFQILSDMEALDPRIVLVSRANKGIPATLNEGISLACGKWIAIMNADDIALPIRFERQMEWLAQTGADICGAWVKFFGTADQRILRHPKSDQAIKVGLMFGSMFAQPTVMVKAVLVKKLLYNEAYPVAEDYDLWVRGAQAGWVMTNVQEVLLLYRQHKTQISTVGSPNMLALSQNIRLRRWECIFESFGLQKVWIDEVLKLREPTLSKPSMDVVDKVFDLLLERYHGETRATIFYHMTRLYLRAAGDCPDAVFRWSRLNRSYGVTRGIGVHCQLLLLSLLRIRTDSGFFQILKQVYFQLRA